MTLIVSFRVAAAIGLLVVFTLFAFLMNHRALTIALDDLTKGGIMNDGSWSSRSWSDGLGASIRVANMNITELFWSSRETKHAQAIVDEPDGHAPNKSYFILHVGPPKTATTTLQFELDSFRKPLLEQDNVLYFMPSKKPTKLIGTLRDWKCHRQLKMVREKSMNV